MSIGIPSDDDVNEEVDYIINVVIGIQAPRKLPTKVLSEKERRIWSAVTWPSSMVAVLRRSRELARVKTSSQ